MRRGVIATAAAAGSLAITFGAPLAAEAQTAKEAKVCWTAPKGANYATKVVLDGPTSRSKILANGECKSWNVKPGEYKIIWASVNDYYRTVYNSNIQSQADYVAYRAEVEKICGPGPAGWNYVNLNPTANVKRFKNDYTTEEVGQSGVVRTTLQDNRQTRVNFRMHCTFYGGGG